MIEWWIFLLVGAFAGLLAGLLGIGGGFVIVPVALVLFPEFGISDEYLMHTAVATSLATICITSISSMQSHHQKGAVDWEYVKLLAPGIVAGSLFAGAMADKIPSVALSVLFGIGAMLMAIKMAFGAKQSDNTIFLSAVKPHKAQVVASASVIGGLSTLVGIGGGSLIVPYLHHLGEKMTRCVGTAAACGLPIALAGSLGFIFSGRNANMPEYSLGFIYLPAFFGIIAASVFTAPVGARLAHKLPAQQLKRVFAVFLLLVGLRILLKQLG